MSINIATLEDNNLSGISSCIYCIMHNAAFFKTIGLSLNLDIYKPELDHCKNKGGFGRKNASWQMIG